MTQIIGISAPFQGGKTTASNFIHGHLMKQNLVVEDFKITEDGELSVTAMFRDEAGNPVKSMGILRLDEMTPELEEYCYRKIWPIVKKFSFAGALKDVCISLLGLTWQQCYGSGKDKESLTQIRWEDAGAMPDGFKRACSDWEYYQQYFNGDKTGFMTAREVMQVVGTIFRKMRQNVWLDTVFNEIKADNSLVSVIDDCRYVNEARAIKDNGGLLIRLLKNSDNTVSHSSERELDNYDGWDLVVDNREKSIEECHSEILRFLLDKKIFKPVSLW